MKKTVKKVKPAPLPKITYPKKMSVSLKGIENGIDTLISGAGESHRLQNGHLYQISNHLLFIRNAISKNLWWISFSLILIISLILVMIILTIASKGSVL